MSVKRAIVTALTVLGALAVAGPAAADDGTLTGGATRQGNEVTLVSNTGDTSTTNDMSAEQHSVPAGATFSDLKSLSAEYNPTDDGCATGSPAFQLTVEAKTVSVNFAPTTCALNTFTSTGELVGSTAAIFDLTAFGGSATSTYAQALELLKDKPLTGIAIAAAGGGTFADKEQTVVVRQVKHVVTLGEGEGGGQTKPNPARQCRALQSSMTAEAFRAMWMGVNASGANAFGKCVSTMAKAERQRQGNSVALQRAINADVKTCRADQRRDPAAFRARWGSKGAGLGKCVLARAKTDLARLASTKTKPVRSRRP
jgi:hypothetical protein